MRISLIGMSNIGKSYWAKRLSNDGGFARIDCDALIEYGLRRELTQDSKRGLRGVAEWMGLPGTADYERHSALYMASERQAMKEALDILDKDARDPLVIDTSGSVIYTGDDMLARLRASTRVIYLEASEAHTADMFRRYMTHPKPTIWDANYAPQAGETPRDCMKRCYPALLENRARRYKELAHVTIPFDQHHDHSAAVETMIQAFA